MRLKLLAYRLRIVNEYKANVFSQSGFTLVETLIALTIFVILAGIGFHSLTFFSNYSIDQIIRTEILRNINLAQSQASLTGATVGLCHSHDLKTCSQKYSRSMLLFRDENLSGKITNDLQIISVIDFSKQKGKLHSRFYPHYRNHLLFYSVGYPRNDNGSFWYCMTSETEPEWVIYLSQTGKTRTVFRKQNERLKDKDGKALTCA